MQCTLSALLKNIADTLRAHALEGDQVIIAGEELKGLIDTLDYATEAAHRMEDGHGALPSAAPVSRNVAGAGDARNVTSFPGHTRLRHHGRGQRFSPWRAPWNRGDFGLAPGGDDEDNGGDAA